MQNRNLEKVSTLLQAKLQNHQLSRSLDRIAILLQSLLASTHMEVTDNLSLYNLRRNAAQFSVPSFLEDCYSGYQHVFRLLGLFSVASARFVTAAALRRSGKAEGIRGNGVAAADGSRVQRSIDGVAVKHLVECRVFLTSDGANVEESLQWARRAGTLVNQTGVLGRESIFGEGGSDAFIHTSPQHLKALLEGVDGTMGRAYREKKSVFTIAPINTNHVCSVGLNHQRNDRQMSPSIHANTPKFDGVHILSRILSSTYLHKHIREEGGAYGTGSSHLSGALFFSSFADPNVLRSVNHFVQGSKWLRDAQYCENDIKEARLSLFGEIDAPVEPQTIGFADLFTGKTKEQRQEQRDLLLSMTPHELHELAQTSFVCDAAQLRSCVFGTKESSAEVDKEASWIVEELDLGLDQQQ